MIGEADKKYILNLACEAIAEYFATGKLLNTDERNIPSSLRHEQSCFVTLTIDGQLRGCIGHTEPIQKLYLDIIENAVGAAFADPRFSPLTEEEFKNIEIEVSVLTVARKLDFFGPDDLLNKLCPGKDGVILKRGQRGATYLPQVWEDLPDKKQFLSSLCQKAGLAGNDWEKAGLEVFVYQALVIK